MNNDVLPRSAKPSLFTDSRALKFGSSPGLAWMTSLIKSNEACLISYLGFKKPEGETLSSGFSGKNGVTTVSTCLEPENFRDCAPYVEETSTDEIALPVLVDDEFPEDDDTGLELSSAEPDEDELPEDVLEALEPVTALAAVPAAAVPVAEAAAPADPAAAAPAPSAVPLELPPTEARILPTKEEGSVVNLDGVAPLATRT